jgi:hypothetical protein
MADFTEQLEVIARLRAEVRGHDEAVYAARVRLQQVNQRLGRAAGKQTVTAPGRDRDVSGLRARQATLNARLGQLRETAREIGRELAAIDEQQRLPQHLQQTLTAAQRRADALRARLREPPQQHPVPQDEIDRIAAELASLARSEEQLTDAIAAATERSREQERRARQLRDRQASNDREMEGLRADLQGVQQEVTDRQTPEFEDADAIRAKAKALQAAADRSGVAAVRLKNELRDAIAGLYAIDPHPRVPLARLDDQIPFLLFPVRIETIFAPQTSAPGIAGTELRVRVYPDHFVVHTHEATLTDREVDAGQLYWVELVVAAHLRAEQARRQAAAWRHLVDLFGGQRAAWVASMTRPSDWTALAASGGTQTLIGFLQAAAATFFTALLALPLSRSVRDAVAAAVKAQDGDAFIRLVEQQVWGERVNTVARTRITGFPAADLTKTDAWSRAPRTTVLPDRFVLLLYATEGAAPREVTGAQVADTVFLGPDPMDPKATIVEKDGARTLGGACDWMSDFDAAVAQGLGFRVPLSEQEAIGGFARIVVLGLRLSASAEHGGAMLEELIASHSFSPEGFSLVPQGTPTNNTERNGTGYSDNDPYDDLAFYSEMDAPAFDPDATDPLESHTDGRLLADALGIGYPSLKTVRHADQTDVLEGRAMNTALFPSTLGYWLTRWMAPVVTPDIARLTRAFFTEFVTGRGPLPAVRVGNQPYGVLVTSDMSRWKYPVPSGQLATVSLFDELTPYLRQLHALLAQLEKNWSHHAAGALYVGKSGTDASKVLIDVLGMHPASVEFFQRVGFSSEYLRTLDSFVAKKSYANELASLLLSMPATVRQYLRNRGLDPSLADIGKTVAMHVLWQHYTTALDVPNLVENTPPSETATLTVNYLEWLATAEDTRTIVEERFPGAKPAALLYMLLRNAVLLQLHHGAYEWLKTRSTFDPALEQSLVTTTLPGVRSAAAKVSKLELMGVAVEAVQANHPSPGTSVADWLWRGPTPAEREAAFVKDQRAAIGLLAQAPTAALERALIEHLDCCQYRLDAWETGLFAQRLQSQRRTGAFQQRRTGVYLGAFGWVERVTPKAKDVLRPEDLPPSLRPTDGKAILEEDEVAATKRTGAKRGGFIHAPSFNHAAAAALLRNGYLSHAEPAQGGVLSINLSSERVRRAQFVLEGMRNAQPIEALLGYQFERALHDLTSASAARGDSPVLELNQFIAPYRLAFPFESREIAQAGTGAATETVPPYAVVNGLKLTTATPAAADGYGLAAVLTPPELPNAQQGAAILGVRDALLDTLDAVKDLLTAENAYQLVQGNFDRVAAVSLAQKDARIPPSLEVLNTPRGTEFTFTNRVTLHFADLDPAVPASNPWPGIAMTPRAIAEPGLNRWLGAVFGRAPDDVHCTAYRVATGHLETPIDTRHVTLADLELQPVDLVALTAINANAAEGATELETRIAFFYRNANAVAPDQTVRIDFNPPVAAGELAFAQLFPLARRLRALLGECRVLDGRDFLPAAGGKATTIPVDKANPAGYDAADLRTRIDSALAALKALADALDGPTAPSIDLTLAHDVNDVTDDELFSGRLGDAFTLLETVHADLTDTAAVAVTFGLLDAEALAGTLRAVALFGIADAFPPEADLTSDAARRALLSRAHRVARRLRRAAPADGVIDRAAALVAAAVTPGKSIADHVSGLLQAGQALFSDTLKWLPAFICANEVDLVTADGARGQLLAHATGLVPGFSGADVVNEWLQGLARVRPRIHTWETVRTLADALGDTVLEVSPVQVPHRDQDSWLAVEFPANDPLDAGKSFGISRDTLSIAAHGSAAFQIGAQRGLLLDEWTEEIPSSGENTGIAFRFNQPNAVPPQTLLLAVTPEETGAWDWDALVGTVNDTLARAKRRAVEPSQLEADGLVWNALAPALVSEFSALDTADVSLDLMRIMAYNPITDFYASVKG